MLLSEAERGFILSKQADSRAAKTISKYRWMFRLLHKFFVNPALAEIAPEDLRRFFAWAQSDYYAVRPNGDTSPLSNCSLETLGVTVRAFYTWATDEKLVKERPDKIIKRPHFAQKQVVPFTPEEIKAVLKACEVVEFKATEKRAAHRQRRPHALLELSGGDEIVCTGCQYTAAILGVGKRCRDEDTTTVKCRPQEIDPAQHVQSGRWQPQNDYVGLEREHALERRQRHVAVAQIVQPVGRFK